MGWLNTERPPEKYDKSYIKMFAERIRTAINFMDESNFPHGLTGAVLASKSVPFNALSGYELQLPIVALATPFTTTSTTLVNVGGFLFWSAVWSGNVQMALEVTGASGSAAATATFELHGASGLLRQITTATGTYECLRTSFVDPPVESQTMILRMRTNNASLATGILSAKLILISK